MPKLEKSTDHSHKLISSEDGQDTSAYKISRQSLHAFSGKCPETSPDGRTDRRTDGRTCRKTVTVGRVDQRTHVQVKRGYFRLRTDGRTEGRTDGRTDGQPENIMPPAPKGGGITNINQRMQMDGQTKSQQLRRRNRNPSLRKKIAQNTTEDTSNTINWKPYGSK